MAAAPGSGARLGAERSCPARPRGGTSPRRAAAPRLRGTNFLSGSGAVWRRGAAPAPHCRGAQQGSGPGARRAGGHGRQPEEEEEEALSAGPAVSARRASFSTARLRFARRLSQVPLARPGG